jgi:hypothetical protein
MGSNYHSTSTSGVPTSRANKKATSKATPPLPPSIGACGPPLGPGQHAPPGPAPPFTEHDRATVNNGPSFRDSNSLHPEGPKEPSSRQVCVIALLCFIDNSLAIPLLTLAIRSKGMWPTRRRRFRWSRRCEPYPGDFPIPLQDHCSYIRAQLPNQWRIRVPLAAVEHTYSHRHQFLELRVTCARRNGQKMPH